MTFQSDLKDNCLNILGICLGASTVSMVHIRSSGMGKANQDEKPHILQSWIYPHEGNPKKTLVNALDKLDLKTFDKIAATGRKFRHFVSFSSIPEPQAVEYAYNFCKPVQTGCPAIVSAGGETFMVYVLNRQGKISNVITGNKCASGTGEFFLQQLRRMNVSLKEAELFASDEEPYYVSGRCSVFCKSDCTHATNKGIPKSKVTAGLCRMMANKIIELLKKSPRKNIMITGGCTLNQMMIKYMGEEISGLIVPKEAPYFEALGAALWAVENETEKIDELSSLFNSNSASFDTLSPLDNFQNMVEFKTLTCSAIKPKDVCTLGLDVGSTTTKAVLIRNSDNAILASIYLRTNGDPVGASRHCYKAILDQIKDIVDPRDIIINGLGVCGSGRQIAGLHALTDGIINEIIAHAAAAVYFDNKVDTILEIGGQDAKYTYIVNGVPADYAMNEACSAGTGSFLEESAFETLGVKMEEIAHIAMSAKNPPNFNDQCAAFIASDIKNAIHEGAKHEDIVAGLVYSICMNYSNRVKGNRKTGEKVFMQGGVCYNRAIPLAMAALIGKPIVVPPEPGLMGAFGVALEVKKRISLKLMEEQSFDLNELHNREVIYKKPFICTGRKENCDRKCEIAVIETAGKKYPFGGACNRYYNLRRNIKYDVENMDLVHARKKLIFDKYGAKKVKSEKRGTVGLNRSFMVNTYYPLYSTFFSELGFEIILPDHYSQKGIDQKTSSFCYPAELSHGFFYELLQRSNPVDFIFLPYFKAVPTQIKNFSSQVCPIVQGETFYLQITFRKEIEELQKRGTRLFAPLLDMTEGEHKAKKQLIEMALQMGATRSEADQAFEKAIKKQNQCMSEMKEIGKNALLLLSESPEKIGVVLFARSYNGFVEEAHMGIPNKLASRGVLVLPYDFLEFDGEESKHHMYWGVGQRLMKATRLVKKHPQLFGAFITNFSCGPDSFIIGYFRDIMGQKPSLTLELDSHTADAGLETRIEAFLDIICAYRQLENQPKKAFKAIPYSPARLISNNSRTAVKTSGGEILDLNDPRVTILLPSMGKISTESLNAVFLGIGHNAVAHPPADEAILKLGRANTSCKECLPLILTTGSLLNYVNNRRRKDEVLVYFMPTTSGPCRFGQYAVFMEDLVNRLKIKDVAFYSLTAENTYTGLGNGFEKKAWWAVTLSDAMEDVRSMLLTNAKDQKAALEMFNCAWNEILNKLQFGNFSDTKHKLNQILSELRKIPLKRPVKEVPVIALIGEIFVRRDGISRQYITERLAQSGFAARCSPIAEWLYYLDYLALRSLVSHEISIGKKLEIFVKNRFKKYYESAFKSILSQSGLISEEHVDIKTTINNGSKYISINLGGEAILTVGSALTEIASHVCGVISIGPFGCMPTRLSEAILSEIMTREVKISTEPENKKLGLILKEMDDLPFLSIESDGSPFPQVIDAKLETFCLRAERMHEKMMEYR